MSSETVTTLRSPFGGMFAVVKVTVKKEIKKRRPRDITRVGCPAKLVIELDRNSGQWYVKNFMDEHNHPLAPADLGCLLRH